MNSLLAHPVRSLAAQSKVTRHELLAIEVDEHQRAVTFGDDRTPLPAALDRRKDSREIRSPRRQPAITRVSLIRAKTQAMLAWPRCLPRTRRDASRATSPSCQRYSARDTKNEFIIGGGQGLQSLRARFESPMRTGPESVKSTEGIDIVWVDEAEMVSETSLTILKPTIRKPGSELCARPRSSRALSRTRP
jgi:hypothetical protein